MFDQLNQLDLSPENIARINAILSVLIPTFVFLVGSALVAYAGKHLTKQIKDIYRIIRPQIDDIVVQIDEPTDDPVVLINKWSPVAAKLLVMFGPTVIKALQAGLDELTNVPPQEAAPTVRIGG